MIFKTVFMLFIILLFMGCSPKKLFPTDNANYDSPKNYDYIYSQHRFYSKDGTPLDGLFIKSKQKSKGLIVLVNGMHYNMSYRFTRWLWIVDSGYDLFTFDYRGFGESEELPDLYGFRDDVDAGVEFAHSLQKDKNITLIGQSMGGTFVIDTLRIKEYDYVSLAVIDSTFTSFSSITSSIMMKTIILFPLSWLPYTFVPDELNSIENVEFVDTPMLFVSSDNDFIVDEDNTKILYEKTKTKKALWMIEDADHAESFSNHKVQKAFLKLLDNVESLTLDKEKYFEK